MLGSGLGLAPGRAARLGAGAPGTTRRCRAAGGGGPPRRPGTRPWGPCPACRPCAPAARSAAAACAAHGERRRLAGVLHTRRVLSPAVPPWSGLREPERLRVLRLPVQCKAGRAWALVRHGRSRRATASLSSARSRPSLFGGRLATPAPLSALAPACAARRAGSAPTAACSAATAAPGPPAASAGPLPAPAAGGCLRPGGGFAAAAGLSPAPSALPRLVRGRASATAAGWGAAAACTAAATLGRARGCALRRERVQARPEWPVRALRVTSRCTSVPDPRPRPLGQHWHRELQEAFGSTGWSMRASAHLQSRWCGRCPVLHASLCLCTQRQASLQLVAVTPGHPQCVKGCMCRTLSNEDVRCFCLAAPSTRRSRAGTAAGCGRFTAPMSSNTFSSQLYYELGFPARALLVNSLGNLGYLVPAHRGACGCRRSRNRRLWSPPHWAEGESGSVSDPRLAAITGAYHCSSTLTWYCLVSAASTLESPPRAHLASTGAGMHWVAESEPRPSRCRRRALPVGPARAAGAQRVTGRACTQPLSSAHCA
jgi:hypothetical protein